MVAQVYSDTARRESSAVERIAGRETTTSECQLKPVNNLKSRICRFCKHLALTDRILHTPANGTNAGAVVCRGRSARNRAAQTEVASREPTPMSTNSSQRRLDSTTTLLLAKVISPDYTRGGAFQMRGTQSRRNRAAQTEVASRETASPTSPNSIPSDAVPHSR